MTMKQISVFLDNKPGRLCKFAEILAENSIDMKALNLADSADYGIVRILVKNPDEVKELLAQEGYMSKVNHVVAVSVDDVPGGLLGVVRLLGDGNINIEYVYAFTLAKTKTACVVMRVKDNAAAEEILNANGIATLSDSDIF